jgi:hypothetical protein
VTIPARYTLTEAHIVIVELERRVAELEAALREVRRLCSEGHGDDLIAETADVWLAGDGGGA